MVVSSGGNSNSIVESKSGSSLKSCAMTMMATKGSKSSGTLVPASSPGSSSAGTPFNGSSGNQNAGASPVKTPITGKKFKERIPIKPMLEGINQYLMCQLCSGYLIDATAIIECQHTCKILYRENDWRAFGKFVTN